MNLFLGIDCSTQTLKACFINEHLEEITPLEIIINYDNDLPQYGTKGGIIPKVDPLIAVTPPLVWISALELLFQKMKEKNINFQNIKAISGSAQQHGSVYWKKNSKKILNSLNSTKTLEEQLKNCFSGNYINLYFLFINS